VVGVGQLTLSTAVWEKKEALDRLEGKYAEWLDVVGVPAAYSVAQRLEVLTVDDIRAEIYRRGFEVPGRGHVFGALLRRCSMMANGFLVKAQVQVQSERRRCHARPVDLWRSTVYKGV
jgi:hypothetical protein